jgi:hypothetical protein
MIQKSIALSVLTGIMVASPLAAFADTAKPMIQDDAQFCSRLSEIQVHMNTKMEDRSEKRTTKQSERSEKVSTKRSDRDDRMTTKRAEGELKLDSKLQKALEAGNLTVEQKDQIRSAWIEKNSAVDSVIATARNEHDNLTAEQKVKFDALVATFTAAQNQAFTNATSACNKGVDSKTVATTFRSEMKSAHDAFAKGRVDMGLTAGAMKPARNEIRDNRKNSVDTERKGFRDFVRGVFGK